jgi:streptogramin lyase
MRRGLVLVMTALVLVACESVGEPTESSSPAASAPDTTAAPPSPAVASPPPSAGVESLQPTGTISLSGGTATGLVEADGALWVVHFEDGVLSRVDPESEVEATTVVGANGTSLTSADETLWVARGSMGAGQSQLTAVDPATGEVEQDIPLPNVCCQVAAAADHVWAVDPAGRLYRVDPIRGTLVDSRPVRLDPLNGHVDLAGDDRALWVSSDTTALTHVDPATGDAVEELDVGGGIPMLLDGDLLWGASPHHVWAIDPATGEQRTSFELADTMETFSIAVTGDAIWVGARRPGQVGVVRRYDLTTHVLTGQADAGLPARVVLAQSGIWVLDAESNQVLRFDP